MTNWKEWPLVRLLRFVVGWPVVTFKFHSTPTDMLYRLGRYRRGWTKCDTCGKRMNIEADWPCSYGGREGKLVAWCGACRDIGGAA